LLQRGIIGYSFNSKAMKIPTHGHKYSPIYEGDMMNQNTILKRADNVTFETVADEAILIDMNSGTYFSLDEVGTLFWEKLDGGQTLGDLAEQIAAGYNEKAKQYVTEVSKLAPAASQNQIEYLALKFGLEEEDVGEHLERFNLDQAEQTASAGPALVEAFRVGSAQVLDDLVELAETMRAENLIVAVK